MDLSAQHDALHVPLQKTVPAESYSKLTPSQAEIEPKKPQKTAMHRLSEPKFPESAAKWTVFSFKFFPNCSLAIAIDQSHRPIRWNNHGMPFALPHEAACRANVAATVKWRSFRNPADPSPA